MPADDWVLASSGANDRLQVPRGVTDGGAAMTNQASEFDLTGNTWAALPNSNNAAYRGGGSCGMYKVGGSTGAVNPTPFPEGPPGWDQCGARLTSRGCPRTRRRFDVAPGDAVTVRSPSTPRRWPAGRRTPVGSR